MILLAATFWGMIGLFTRQLAALGFTSMQIAAFRSIVSALLLSAYLAIRSPKELKISLRDLPLFLGTGVCSLLFFNVCYFTTINLTSLSTAAILLYTAPAFVTIMSAIVFHEKITARKTAALILALSGCAFVTGFLRGQPVISAFGLLTGIGSGFGYALYSIFGPFALRKYSSMTVTVYTFITCGVCSFPLLRPAAALKSISAAPVKSLMLIVLLALISTVAPYLLYTAGLKNTEPGRASVMASLEPVVATLTGVIVFRESLGWDALLGAVLVLSAVVLLNLPDKNKPKETK